MKKLLNSFFVLTLLIFGVSLFCNNNAIAATTYKQVHAAHILVDTQEQAQQIKNQIDNGMNFRNLARQYSKCPSGNQGGDLGFFGKGQMVKEFEDAAFATPIGKVSNPIKTKFGWHLIKVYDKN